MWLAKLLGVLCGILLLCVFVYIMGVKGGGGHVLDDPDAWQGVVAKIYSTTDPEPEEGP